MVFGLALQGPYGNHFLRLLRTPGLFLSLVMPPRILRERRIKTGRIPADSAAGIKDDPFDPPFPPNPRVGLVFFTVRVG